MEPDRDTPTWQNGVTLKLTSQGAHIWTIAVAADDNSLDALREAKDRAIDLNRELEHEFPDRARPR